jgi:hypothetical protein
MTAPRQDLEHDVLVRDEFTCQTCGARGEDAGGRERMRVGYVARNDSRVKNSIVDLRTLCPACDEGFANANLLPRMNAQQLLVELRRASVADQIAALDWLLKKYPKRA